MSRNGTNDRNIAPNQDAFLKLYHALSKHYGSNKKASDAIGVHDGHMSQILSGRQNIPVSLAKKILAAYKMAKDKA